ncbi:MAG: CRTAC1 family protein, partial [Verrucomicrobiota bacterium]
MTKLGLTLLFLLVAIPILVRMITPQADTNVPAENRKTASAHFLEGIENDHVSSSWVSSARWLVTTFLSNLWMILRTTVPWMVLAGILGATLVTLIPFESITQVDSSNRIVKLCEVLGLALFGLFLPVPMAFDVIITSVLLTAGLPSRYAAVLLFTLGIFSIYPFSIIWRSYSPRMAWGIAFTLITFGTASAGIAHVWQKQEDRRQFSLIIQEMAKVTSEGGEWPERDSGAKKVSPDRLRAAPFGPETIVSNKKGTVVSRESHRTPDPRRGPKLFTRVSGESMGLNEPVRLSGFKVLEPFTAFRPISSGDVNNDGWIDLLIGSDPSIGGMSLYLNDGGVGFVREAISISSLKKAYVCNAALVDFNNDGWLDICVATYREGAFIAMSDEGRFSESGLRELPLPQDTVTCASLAFADLDFDHDIDIVAGRWSIGMFGSIGSIDTFTDAPITSSNFILRQGPNGDFEREALPGPPGETLTTLVSDINDDGYPDLAVGNDFDEPDSYYLGGSNGELKYLTSSDGYITRTTRSTMSLITCDVDNDLRNEVYIAQIGHGDLAELQKQTLHWIRNGATDVERRQFRYAELVRDSMARQNPGLLRQINHGQDRQALLSAVMLGWTRHEQRTGNDRTAKWLKHIDASAKDLHFIANHLSIPRYRPTEAESREFIPQQRFENILFCEDRHGILQDQASEFGIAQTGWAWNCKFADVNQDQYADLYVANGWEAFPRRESNQLYLNDNGERFHDATQESGAADRSSTSAYTYVDFDNDGDLDIVTVPISSEVRVFVNETRENRSIDFQLRDHHGNRRGIGAKIIISYGPNGSLTQAREILASGGFISFDAPVAHFGLGRHDHISKVEVRWVTGDRTVIEQKLTAGARYTITR